MGMRWVFSLLLAASLGACAPAPANMPATQASEVLARFAAGSASANVCTPEGRAVLRGAVRAYGQEMSMNGVAWPMMPGFGASEALNSVDVSVLVAFAAGFVEVSDLHGPARRFARRLSFTQWPEIRSMRDATRVACDEVVALQQAAARVVIETERLRLMTQRAGGALNGDRVRRQHDRVERAHLAMQQIAAQVQARMDAANPA
jgi:hypothetical protein